MYFVAITHSKHLLRFREFLIEFCSGSAVHYRHWSDVRGKSHGVCAAQREEVLPRAQRAARREGEADSPGPPWGTRADHRASGARSFQETPVCGAELASPAGASERPGSGSRRCQFPGRTEAGRRFARSELRVGGPVSARSPNFWIV